MDQKSESHQRAHTKTTEFASVDSVVDQLPIFRRLHALLKHPAFECFMGAAIIFNVGIIIMETDQQATCRSEHCSTTFTTVCNVALLCLYSVELSLRVVVKRRKVLKSMWFYLDLIIIGTGFLELVIDSEKTPNFQMLRLFRILRLSRMVKMLRHFPTLYFLLRGFAGAMEAIMWGVMLILILLLLWAIVAVELLHEVNETIDHGPNAEWCEVITESVFRMVLYLFQTLVAGDSWGTCSIPIMQERPLSYLIFAGSLVTVQLGFTNLILAIIVDKAVMAREADNEELIKVKQQQKMRFAQHLKEVLQQADHDNSGTLSLDEMKQAYEQDAFVRKAMNMMDVDRGDLATLFHFMGAGTDGEVGWEEFVEVFQKCQTQDMRVYLMVMKLQIEQLYNIVHEMRHGVLPPSRYQFSSMSAGSPSVSQQDLSPAPSDKPICNRQRTRARNMGSASSVSEIEKSQESSLFFRQEFSEASHVPSQPQFSSAGPGLTVDEELQKLHLHLEAKFKDIAAEVVRSAADLLRAPGSPPPRLDPVKVSPGHQVLGCQAQFGQIQTANSYQDPLQMTSVESGTYPILRLATDRHFQSESQRSHPSTNPRSQSSIGAPPQQQQQQHQPSQQQHQQQQQQQQSSQSPRSSNPLPRIVAGEMQIVRSGGSEASSQSHPRSPNRASGEAVGVLPKSDTRPQAGIHTVRKPQFLLESGVEDSDEEFSRTSSHEYSTKESCRDLRGDYPRL